jgi:uncharacterized membrane protein YjgN (DUF898 family)
MLAVQETDSVTRYESFEFTGDGREYFRIWIVNILLSVVTLGIYSAWAKVRRLEYFYRHTRVGGATFDYHGRPLAILKGRIVAALLFGGYYAAALVSPAAGLAAAGVLGVILPWLMNRSLMFRFYNSSYRGLRFQFHGSTREAYWVMLGLPVLSVLTLFGLAPFWHQRLKRYVHANAAYGKTRFTFDAPVGRFYKAYLIIAACTFGLLVVSLFFLFMVTMVLGLASRGQPSAVLSGVMVAFVLIVYVLGAMGLMALTRAHIENLAWRHTSLGSYRFTCTLEPHRLLWLTLTNMLKVVATLGLYKPIADVRLAKYVLGELTLVGVENMNPFLAGDRQNVTATGEEAAEIFDVDFAF